MGSSCGCRFPGDRAGAGRDQEIGRVPDQLEVDGEVGDLINDVFAYDHVAGVDEGLVGEPVPVLVARRDVWVPVAQIGLAIGETERSLTVGQVQAVAQVNCQAFVCRQWLGEREGGFDTIF